MSNRVTKSTDSTTVADLLERLLDKGVVISGDIRIKLVDVELLTLEIRLLICSVDKAVEMGLDWWTGCVSLASCLQRPPTTLSQLAHNRSPFAHILCSCCFVIGM